MKRLSFLAVVLLLALLCGACGQTPVAENETREETDSSVIANEKTATEETTSETPPDTSSAATPSVSTTDDQTPPEDLPPVDLQPRPASCEVSCDGASAADCGLLTLSDQSFCGVFARFGFETGEGGLPVRITVDPALEEEEYRLSVKKNAVTVAASGERGVFAAVSTLAQLRCGERLPAAEIEDKPAVPLRGVIEGFYGDAWTDEFRLDLFDFMGEYKLNTYIYAPKDDLKHRQNWRSLYTGRELDRMKALVSRAKENCVRFVYAISPGLSIDLKNGYEKDFEKLCQKCQSMYEIGVRDFAIFLDDIDSRDAQGHAKLLNDFETKFCKTHEDCADLIAISPEYQTGWLTKYTNDLAPLLHSDILMMWTGRETLPDSIKKGDLTAINRKYGGKVFIWWNYPCNDFAVNNLFMGPCVNLDKNLSDSISGLVSNPMNQGYASLLPLLTISDYLWNPTAYDPEGSVRSACAHLSPGSAEGLYDLMDLTRASVINGYQSSLELAPLIEAYGKGEEGAEEALSRALDRISGELEALWKNGDPRLLSEIGKWLEKARAYVDAARAVVSFDQAKSAEQRGEAAMRCAVEYKKTFGNSSAVSGDLLEPFVFEARARFNLLSGKSVLTNLPVYQNYLPDNAIDGDPSTYFWSSEPPSPGKYFTVDLGEIREVSGVRLSMGSDAHKDDYIRRGVLEYSIDGKTFVKLCDLNTSTVDYDGAFTARQVRMRCTDSQNNWVIISEFVVKGVSDKPTKGVSTTLPTYQNYAPGYALDGDPATYFWSASAPTSGSSFTVDLGAVREVSGVRLSMGSDEHMNDYVRKGVIEYSNDGTDYTTLCSLNGRTLQSDEPFTARYVRLRCTAYQTYWVIISEFSVRCPTTLPDGVTLEGGDEQDLSPLFDRNLFTVFSPDPKTAAGMKLHIDPAGADAVEIYLFDLSGVRVFRVGKDGKREEYPLSHYIAPETKDAAEIVIEFLSERAGVSEISITRGD